MDGGPGHRVEVGGSVTGSVVVGDHNIVVTAERSHVTVVQQGRRPQARRREEVRLLPRRAHAPVGRGRELAAVSHALSEGGAVQVSAPSGAGKSTLLRMCAHEARADRRGVAFIGATGQDLGDILQEVFAACYDAPGYRPTGAELRRLMAGIGATLVLDDLECPRQDLDSLLDTLPDAAVLLSSSRRTLWGNGDTMALEGLGHADALALLSRALGHPLDESEQALADELFLATSGNPHRLLLASAEGRLARPAELPDLLPRIVGTLEPGERAVLSVLALAGPTGVGTGLLSALAAPGTDTASAGERLERLGLAVPTEGGLRSAPDPDGGAAEALAPPSGAELAALADRLLHWVTAPDRSPGDAAAAEGLLSRIIDALDHDGSAETAVRLARAAAPTLACSLRTGAWGRLVERGRAAAERARDKGALAYFLHEEGVRSLVTGRRAAAAAGFAAAAALWRELGDEGAAQGAEEGAELCGPEHAQAGSTGDGGGAGEGGGAGDGGGGADPGPSGDALSAASPPPGGEAAGGAAHHSGGLGSEVAGAADPGGAVTSTATTTLSSGTGSAGTAGAGITAKLMIGGGLAVVTAGGVVLGQQVLTPDTVPVSVIVATAVAEVAMPGEPGEDCVIGDGATHCTTVVDSEKGETGPIEVDPDAPLPAGVAFRYWGCEEGPEAESCTVEADAALTVCISTTAPEDAANRRACAEATGTSAFRPVAWLGGGVLKAITEPGGEPEVLAEETVGESLVWSSDGTKAAWLEPGDEDPNDPSAAYSAPTIHLRDLEGGEDRTWTCDGCTIAFVGDTLVSTGFGSDLYSYPDDGGEPTAHDVPEIAEGPPGDIATAINLVSLWSGGEQRTYAHVSDDPDDIFQAAVYEILSPEQARRLVDVNYTAHSREDLVAVSPDGTRGLVAAQNFGVSTSPCAPVAPVHVVDMEDGSVQTRLEPEAGRSLSAAWFDDDGTAHTAFMPYEPDSDYASEAEFAGHCIYDSSAEPEGYSLEPEADAWSPAEGGGLREADLGEGWTAHYGDGRLVLQKDGEEPLEERAEKVFTTG